jgi:hypothetical protein
MKYASFGGKCYTFFFKESHMRSILTKVLIFILMVLLSPFVYSSSYSYSIDDTTSVWKVDSNSGNIIGTSAVDVIPGDDNQSSQFNIFGIDITYNEYNLITNYDIYTNFNGYDNTSGLTTYYADMFFDTDLDGSFDYGLNLFQSFTSYKNNMDLALYDITNPDNIINSSDFFDSHSVHNHYGGLWNNPDDSMGEDIHVPVAYDYDPNELSTINVKKENFGSNPNYTLEFAINLSEIGLASGDEYGIFLASANCGNDIIYGTSTVPTPEPTTMLLFGTGLLGLAGLAKRKIRSN